MDSNCGIVIYGYNIPFPGELFDSDESLESGSDSGIQDEDRILGSPTNACVCPSHERIFGHFLTAKAPGLYACTLRGAMRFEGFPQDVSVSCLLQRR